MTVSETPDFPEMFKPLASAMAEALSDLHAVLLHRAVASLG